MRSLFSAIVFILFSAVLPCTSYCQSSDIVQKVLERISKLESVCGSWSGNVGSAGVVVSLEMEDTSSAIGELQKKGKIYFIHCFADDMDKTDAYSAGPCTEYDYCMLEQDGGENVGVYYLSLKDDSLTGIYVSGSVVVSVNLIRESMASEQVVSFDMLAADEDKWENARYLDTAEAYEAYLKEFPDGKHVAEAGVLLQSIGDRHAWEKTQSQNTIAAYQEYLDSSLQIKSYIDKAVAGIAMIEAKEADAAGDFVAALSALEVVEKKAGLSDDALEIIERNLERKNKDMEAKSYMKYLDSKTQEEAIRNGIEYVNTFISAENRAEVSDKVAYMMASNPAYLAGTSCEIMLTYARTDETRSYVEKQTKKAARQRSKNSNNSSNVGFNAGFGAAFEMPLGVYAPVYGGHFLFSLGDNRNFLNFEFGVRYRYWQFGEIPGEGKNVDFHHMRLVAAPKFNVVRQKKSAFYMYFAPELGYGYPIDMYGTGMYEANSVSLGGRLGIGVGMFDLSAIYTYDYVPLVTSDFPAGKYSPQQVGLALTFYFSGSGR